MLKLNLKIAWRNLLKNKTYTSINVLGLALGLAGFIFILIYINHEKNYDHWDPSLKNVYQVHELDFWAIKEGKKEWMDAADQRFAELLETSMPQVEAVTQITGDVNTQSIIIDKKEPFLQKDILSASPSFFKVFPFHFIYGDLNTAFTNPQSVVIKESFAQKHFGNTNPVGKTIKINQQNWTMPKDYIITGVVAEPKFSGSVNFELVQYWPQRKTGDQFYSFATTYVKFKTDQSLSNLNQIAQSIYFPFKSALLIRQKQPINNFIKAGIKPSVRFQPLYDVHQNPLNGPNWLNLIKPVILLSTLLLLISMINFINMFTAQAVSRAKEVGVKKVIGADKKSLIFQFLLEIALQCTTALFLSVILLEGFLPYLNYLFNLSLSFLGHLHSLVIMAELIMLLVVVTLLTGIYPAFFLSAYKSQDVLKGNFEHSHKGKFLRSAMVALQFIIAVGFLTSIIIISRQLSYMENRDPGFNANAIINVQNGFGQKIAKQIKNIDGVEYVGSNDGMIGLNHKLNGSYKFKNESKKINTVLVNFEGLQALGVKLQKGRLFDFRNAQDSLSSVIINERLNKSCGGNMLGEFLWVNDSIPAQVVGIIKDIQVEGFENLIEPTVYTASKVNATGYPINGMNHLIRFQSQKQKSVLAEIDKLWKSAYPSYPITYTYVKDDLIKVLAAHQRFKRIVKAFSFLSIFLSLIGLFSLAAFLTRQRIKEIAIRKILGADHPSIFWLLNKEYLKLMLAANVLSWPIIYLAINYWLKGFAYRIDLPIFPFVTALIVSIIITLVTVSLQVKNAVMATPVEALKHQ